MNELFAGSVESALWNLALAYRGWLMMAGIAFIAFQQRERIVDGWAKLTTWLSTRRTSVTTGTPSELAGIEAYGVLKARLKSNPDGLKALKAVWPFLEGGE